MLTQQQAPNEWEELGHNLAILSGIATFLGSWWYCAATYGFLFGFGLGWLPSAILATLVGAVLFALWPLVLTAAGLALFGALASVASCTFG